MQAVEKLINSLKKLGIKYVDCELVYDEEEAGYEYFFENIKSPKLYGLGDSLFVDAL